jgi:hypothetical protein
MKRKFGLKPAMAATVLSVSVAKSLSPKVAQMVVTVVMVVMFI